MSELKRIPVSIFVEKYNKLGSEQLKDRYLKEHIKTTYAPIMEKINTLKLMNEKSVVEGTTGKYIDLIVSKLNLVMAILVLYTDITPDKAEDGTVLGWASYDALKESGLLDKILNYIGSDLEELMSIQSNIMDTWYAENTSIQAYVSNLVNSISQKFGIAAGLGLEKLMETIDDETNTEKFKEV